MSLLSLSLWLSVVCGSALEEALSRVWSQKRLTYTADLHHLIMPPVFE